MHIRMSKTRCGIGWQRGSIPDVNAASHDPMSRRLEDGSAGDICGSELPFSEVAKRAGAIGEMCKKIQCCTYAEGVGWKLDTAYHHVHDQSHCLFDINGRCVATA